MGVKESLNETLFDEARASLAKARRERVLTISEPTDEDFRKALQILHAIDAGGRFTNDILSNPEVLKQASDLLVKNSPTPQILESIAHLILLMPRPSGNFKKVGERLIKHLKKTYKQKKSDLQRVNNYEDRIVGEFNLRSFEVAEDQNTGCA